MGLTLLIDLCLTANVKRCTVVKTEPISQHENLTIKRQQPLTKHYLNQTPLEQAAVENDAYIRKLPTDKYT